MSEEEFKISRGALWTHFPIPAYQVLGRAQEYNAQRVLLCLVSHLGKGSRVVYPSYDTIARESGVRNRKTINRSLKTLAEFGFIQVYAFREGRKKRARYLIKDCAWMSYKMNHVARRYIKAVGRCLACLRYVQRSDINISGDLKAHYGCGGVVMWVAERELPEKQVPWRDRIGD